MCVGPFTHPTRGPLKCGQCVECRLAYSREWAIRMMHELHYYEHACMATLTYDDAHLPDHGQLLKSDVQKFLKRLRKNTGAFRYVASGEYGELNRRPHFHLALFGLDFHLDRIRSSESINGDPCYISTELSRSWQLGHHEIGTLNFESCAYITRYIMKKLKGPNVSPVPLACDPVSGELIMPNPEFMLMSKGIGKRWFRDFFMSDVYPHASVVTAQGSKAPVPRYYKELLKEVGTDMAFDMSARTMMRMGDKYDVMMAENVPARRLARGAVLKSRSGVFKRELKG